MERFVPLGCFVLGTFFPRDLMSWDVSSWDVMSLGTLCLGTLCPLGRFVLGRFVCALLNVQYTYILQAFNHIPMRTAYQSMPVLEVIEYAEAHFCVSFHENLFIKVLVRVFDERKEKQNLAKRNIFYLQYLPLQEKNPQLTLTSVVIRK